MSLDIKPTYRGWSRKVGAFGMSASELILFGTATLLCLQWLELPPLQACFGMLAVALVWRFINAHTLPGAIGTVMRYIFRAQAWSTHGACRVVRFEPPQGTDDEK